MVRQGFPWTGPLTRSLLVTLLMASQSGCWGGGGQTYMTETVLGDLSSPIRKGNVSARAEGFVEPRQLLQILLREEVVQSWPDGPVTGPAMYCDQTTRLADVIRGLERSQSWVYDPLSESFYVATATHSADGPDAFGRATASDRVPVQRRAAVAVWFKFRKVSAGASVGIGHGRNQTLSAGAGETTFCASVPDGVPSRWDRSTERSYFEGVRDPAAGGADVRQVETQRRVVSSGLAFEAITARLPGGAFRIDGKLEISAFVGRGLDRTVVTTPIQLDGPRHEWLRTLVISGGDVAGDVAFRHFGLDTSATTDSLEVLVKVD